MDGSTACFHCQAPTTPYDRRMRHILECRGWAGTIRPATIVLFDWDCRDRVRASKLLCDACAVAPDISKRAYYQCGECTANELAEQPCGETSAG